MLPEPTAEPELLLSKDEAMSLVAQYNRHYDNLVAVVLQMWNGRADLAMGCESWDSFASKFLNGYKLPKLERKQVHQELAQAGLSTRAIASVTGVDHKTVGADIKSVGEFSPPAEIKGLDGKVYSPIRLVPSPPPADAVVEAVRDLPAEEHLDSEAKRLLKVFMVEGFAGNFRRVVQQFPPETVCYHATDRQLKPWLASVEDSLTIINQYAEALRLEIQKRNIK